MPDPIRVAFVNRPIVPDSQAGQLCANVSPMAVVSLTSHLRGIARVERSPYPGETVRAVIEALLAEYPQLRSYLLDEQGRLRKHVAIFVDGVQWRGQKVLEHPADTNSEIVIMQALSGG